MGGQKVMEAQGAPAEPTAKTRVLVVDDHPDIARSYLLLFRIWGFDVEVARDGRSALETALTFRPEIAVLDIGLPGMDGFELGRTLREKYGPAIVLIAVTGYGEDESRKRSEAAGFDCHLTKPVDLETLSSLMSSRSS